MKNVFLKHKAYRDVCIHIRSLRQYGPYLIGRGEFWNLSGYNMGYPTKVRIKESEMNRWLYSFEPPKTANWKELSRDKNGSLGHPSSK